MQRKFKLLREAAYEEGRHTFDWLAADPTVRDFVCMYVGDGTKRDRNRASLGNSDPRVVLLATRWLRRFSRNPLRFELQYHADRDPAELREFWGRLLEIDPGSIALQQRQARRTQLAMRARSADRESRRHPAARAAPGLDRSPPGGVVTLAVSGA
jgi:hypothetical protein